MLRFGASVEYGLRVSCHATHNATHDRTDLHVLGRTYAAVRDLQVVGGMG